MSAATVCRIDPCRNRPNSARPSPRPRVSSLPVLRRYFPSEVFRTIIPRNVRLSEAPSHGKTILSYAPLSVGAMAYQALAQEFIARVEGVRVDFAPAPAQHS